MLYDHKKATALFHLVQCASQKILLKPQTNRPFSFKWYPSLDEGHPNVFLIHNYWHTYNIMLGDHRKKSRRVKNKKLKEEYRNMVERHMGLKMNEVTSTTHPFTHPSILLPFPSSARMTLIAFLIPHNNNKRILSSVFCCPTDRTVNYLTPEPLLK